MLVPVGHAVFPKAWNVNEFQKSFVPLVPGSMPLLSSSTICVTGALAPFVPVSWTSVASPVFCTTEDSTMFLCTPVPVPGLNSFTVKTAQSESDASPVATVRQLFTSAEVMGVPDDRCVLRSVSSIVVLRPRWA